MAERRGTKALEHWCRRVTDGYNGVKVENMTTSWRDGLAFCAVIHHFRPDLINFEQLKNADIYENNYLAFTIAEKYLGIPALLDAADMAAYDVPDRLSILTYLSQFYKVLAKTQNGDKKNIAKRTNTDKHTEEEQLAKTHEPPPKMAHVVGVPRRDPCQKCKFPVFLAERMLIGKNVYHRTCLKCARCDSQLTLGSFYETEVNNEYCCETCPDEETGAAGGGDDNDVEVDIGSNKLTTKIRCVEETNLKSISDRSAFFEQNVAIPPKTNIASSRGNDGQEVLESSVSDEQKRKHFIGRDENDSEKKIYRSSLALSNFLQQTVNETDNGPTNESSPSTSLKRYTVTIEQNLQTVDTPSNVKPKQLERQSFLHPIVKIEGEDKTIDQTDQNIPQDALETSEVNYEFKSDMLNTTKTSDQSKEEDKQSRQTEIESETIAIEKLPPFIEERQPVNLNPFDTDDSSEENDDKALNQQSDTSSNAPAVKAVNKLKADKNRNPFDSSDDEVELEKQGLGVKNCKIPPPRPPPPRISYNLSNADADIDADAGQRGERRSSLSLSKNQKMPLPTPRTSLSQSRTSTPESTPRLSSRSAGQQQISQSTPKDLQDARSLQRNTDGRGSSTSLPSSTGGTIRSRKLHRAPVTPAALKELFPTALPHDHNIPLRLKSADSHETPLSSQTSPKSSQKKRPAPAPPKPARLDAESQPTTDRGSTKLSEEASFFIEPVSNTHRRLIPLDQSLLSDDGVELSNCDDDLKQCVRDEESDVVYRRILMPPSIESPSQSSSPPIAHNRQLEKLKDNKEAQNRTRQTQDIRPPSSSNAITADSPAFYDKSIHGKWKRRKGPAPAVPIPPRKVLQMLPLQEIRHELEIIEVQQQGLEKQGVILEKMIRDRCEGSGDAVEKSMETPAVLSADTHRASSSTIEHVQNSKEVEDLILQLFELVNEKNELFRRQAELMYLRRQYRLEQDQADIEYEIRVLMGQPERNKTDTDKAREEILIARLVEIVELRNDVIDCLETDRLREAEEDLSIKERLLIYNSKRETSAAHNKSKNTTVKLSKKEKKQLREVKKLSKSKNIDIDKDADESEMKHVLEKVKKKRHLFF